MVCSLRTNSFLFASRFRGRFQDDKAESKHLALPQAAPLGRDVTDSTGPHMAAHAGAELGASLVVKTLGSSLPAARWVRLEAGLAMSTLGVSEEPSFWREWGATQRQVQPFASTNLPSEGGLFPLMGKRHSIARATAAKGHRPGVLNNRNVLSPGPGG